MSSLGRFFFALFTGLVIFSFIFFMAAFTVSQSKQSPSFQVESASLNQLTVNDRKLETKKMSAEWNITVLVSDPNEYLRVSYQGTLNAEVFYRDENGDVTLSTSTMQPFNGNMIELKLKADSYEPLHVAEGIVRSLHKNGRVNFGLKVMTSIKFKKDMFDSDWKPLKAVCYPLSFVSSQNVYNFTTPAWILLQASVTCTSTK